MPLQFSSLMFAALISFAKVALSSRLITSIYLPEEEFAVLAAKAGIVVGYRVVECDSLGAKSRATARGSLLQSSWSSVWEHIHEFSPRRAHLERSDQLLLRI